MTDTIETLPNSEKQAIDPSQLSEMGQLESWLADVPVIAELHDHLKYVLDTNPQLDFDGRDDLRYTRNATNKLMGSPLGRNLAKAFDELPSSELCERFKGVISEMYPERFQNTATFLVETLDQALRGAEAEVHTGREARIASSDRTLELVAQTMESVRLFISEEPTPENAANIITLLANAHSYERDTNPHAETLSRAVAISLTQPKYAELLQYISDPNEELYAEITRRQLEAGYAEDDRAIQEQVDFSASLLGIPSSNALALIMNSDPATFPTSLATATQTRVREVLENAAQNIRSIVSKLNLKPTNATETQIDDDFLYHLLSQLVIDTVRVAQGSLAKVSGKGVTQASLDPVVADLCRYLQSEEKLKSRRRQITAPVSSEISISLPTQERDVTPERELEYTPIQNGSIASSDKTVESLIHEFSDQYHDADDIREVIETILIAMTHIDFSKVVSGVKKVHSAIGKLKDQDGNDVALFELKPSQFSDISTKGTIANAIRIYFTLSGKDKIGLAGIVKRKEMNTWLKNRGIPSR
jgi:hypothetical protein